MSDRYQAKREWPGITLYHADCLDLLPIQAEAVITDPPYPNGANLFLDGIESARCFLEQSTINHAIVFWDELDTPYYSFPLVARHVWHRTNTNRPDNYEAIYEFHSDGKKRASRVMPYAVIAVGLTGCVQATGHPTQKHEGLMTELAERTSGSTILDPFMGSGTTGIACIRTGRNFIGIEKDACYFQVACDRIERELAQGQLFEPATLMQPKQSVFL